LLIYTVKVFEDVGILHKWTFTGFELLKNLLASTVARSQKLGIYIHAILLVKSPGSLFKFGS
jgi:hypothetical protein